MRKKVVAIDMDDTILWLMKGILADHNKKYPDHQIKYEDMIAFDDSMMHPEYNKMEYFLEPGTFFNLEIMDEYVVDEMKKIHEAYDLIIVTSSFPEAVVDKWNWIQKHLPFIPYENFISATRKDLINADLLIDDAVHNIRDWSKKGKPAISILHHWNHEVTSYPNVYTRSGWKGMKEYVDSILN